MPHDIPATTVNAALFELWDEILGQVRPGTDTHVLDPAAGWAQTLAAVDAASASRPIAPGATSIAGQTAHAIRSLEYLEEVLSGDDPKVDWPSTFLPDEVDDDAWVRQRQRLVTVADRVAARLRANPEWQHERILRVMSHVVHLAYHLGAVRQMLRVVRR